jgi:nucleoside-diphosphate-sugar epimerase
VRVAVTGATGYVGRFIISRLINSGVEVRAWRRASSDVRGLPDKIDWVEGELGSRSAAQALVEGADALVHGALAHVPGRYRGGEGEDLASYLALNVGGSLALLAAARAAGVGRCVVLSSRAVFGARMAGPISDDQPLSPDTHYGASKAALESFVRSWGLGEGWAIAAIRPTGVYGIVEPLERSKWFDLVGAALRSEPVAPRAGTEVHGRDVAECVWWVLQADAAEITGRAFNLSDIAVSTRDIVRLVHRFARINGPLPHAAPAPSGVMSHDGATRLGVNFGGWALFEETIAQLVAAVQARRSR